MPLTVTTESNVAVTPGANVEIVDALVGRKSLTVQLQGEGFAWIRLGGAAAVDVGFRIRGWEVVHVDSSFGIPGGTNQYEGPLNLFWEGGGVDPATNLPLTTVNVRAIELS